MGAQMIVEALARLADLTPVPQPAEGITYARKIDKAEARIDWARPAASIARQINGLSPFPGAWCLAGTERLKLLRARAVPGHGLPGHVLDGLRIACGDGAVEVLDAQREGKRPVDAAELLRGWTPLPVLG
jgi:methionyl-tRNA formyltransferase